MKSKDANYQSYLVRFWHVDNAGHPVWRAAVQEPGSEMQTHFEGFSELCAYLAARLESGGSEAYQQDVSAVMSLPGGDHDKT